MKHQSGLYLLGAALVVSILSVVMDSPPNVIGADASDSLFSAQRAFVFTNEICKAPHSTGTAENKRVREYITEKCKGWGLETVIQNTTAVRKRRSTVIAANVFNIVARLKGQQSNKCVIVMAHYDTQPNTPGVGDDGAGVSAMLETARILTSSKTVLKNDVIFLFTDAEELGLLGAQGFMQDSVLAAQVGIVLNYEGRGNSGVSTLFEVNPKNGWAVENYIKAAEYPAGNSLGYEIYKTLPNDTDYTIFREAGISGLNSAFIGGFVNYHSPNDTPDHLDLRSLQHHGSNMLSLVKHFGNISLDETKADDISFFNVIGYQMISYPASWNLFLTILCVLTYLTFVVIGYRKGQLTRNGFIAGFLSFIGLLIVLIFSTLLFIRGLGAIYPLYKNFYASNSYNVYWYAIAFTSLSVILFSVLNRWLLTKFTLVSLHAGILLAQVIILVLLYRYMSTAIFIILFPLFFVLVGSIISLLKNQTNRVFGMLLQFSLTLPAILLLSPTVKQLYTVFGLAPQVVVAIMVISLLLGLLLPIFNYAFGDSRNAVPIIGTAGLVISIILAHITSRFSEQHPLQSNVRYQLEVDNGKAYWISDFDTPDDWNNQFMSNASSENGVLKSETAILPFSSPIIKIRKDTIENDRRKIYMHCESTRNSTSIVITMKDPNLVSNISVIGPAGGMGNKLTTSGYYKNLFYTGLDGTGVDLVMETKPNVPVELTLTDRSIGLPMQNKYKDYPKNIIPGVGWNANTIQVVKTYVF